jgi:ribose transport system substrate-binding protein
MTASALRIGIFAALWLIAGGAIASARELKSIGVSLPDLSTPFFSEVNRGITNAAKGIGANIIEGDNQYDLAKQVQQIQDFVAQKVELIILFPDDPKALDPVVKQAQAAGVFVVAVGRPLGNADANVGTDSAEAASLACDYLAQQLGQSGNVVIINGPPDPIAEARVAGCKATISKFPNMKVISSDQNGQWTEAGGKAAMLALLQQFNTIDGVFAVNSDEARGSELALRAAGRKVKAIVSVGATFLDKGDLSKDSMIAAVVIERAYSIGEKAIQIGAKLLNGEKVPKDTFIPPVVVNRETLESYPDCCRLNPPTCGGCVQ